MKLFARKTVSVPEQRIPDYDFIAEVEREFRMDDEGFDERIDEAILKEFWASFPCDDDETPEQIAKLVDMLYDVMSGIHSAKYSEQILDKIERYESRSFKLSRREWDKRHTSLRDSMVERGKHRND